jgi:transposase
LEGPAADTDLLAAGPEEITHVDEPRRPPVPGNTARAKGRRRTLNSRRVAALPLLNRFLERLRLSHFLRDHLPDEDGRTRVPTATALLVLLRNLLISREPLYGVGEWAAGYEPELLGLSDTQLAALNDDRIGRALDRLFEANIPALALQVAAHAIREFEVSLDQLHNDSTTITFHGSYESAERERTLRGRLRLAVTWGHNKDHRPDLKQLLYILTVTGDGAVPVQFRVESGNATDDRSHQGTWDLLCQLTGRRDFLYIADCKLATTENMAYLHQRGGRFLSVLPRTRSEDAIFRAAVVRGEVQWRRIHEKYDDAGQLVDQFSICEPAGQATEGYRLIWYHSTRKAELDAEARLTRLEKALKGLDELRAKLASPRTRYRSRAKVAEAVEALLRDCEVTEWISVQIEEQVSEKYRQERRGRPGEKTRYVRQEKLRYSLRHRLELERLDEEARSDGIFPLVSNDRSMTEQELLLAYKQQPAIERRFEHLKTDFVVAPMYLKEVSRIQALLCVYFFVLLVEALLERELRRAMERKGIASLPLYSESRACRRPAARMVIDLYEDVQRHVLRSGKRPPEVFSTELTRLQRRILRLLGMPKAYEG